jgi:hypothetical protein
MSILTEYEGEQVEVYVADSGGMIDCMVRATDEATFNTAAQSVGLLDEGGNVSPGIDLVRVGQIVQTPAVYDDEGNETTPATFFDGYHVNFRLNAASTANGAWKTWAVQWTQNGTDATPHNAEAGRTLSGVTLIDPATIGSPRSVWS